MHSITLFDDAFAILRQHLLPPTIESVPIRQATGRVLAFDAEAMVAHPPFARSMMDGFAICTEDLTSDGVMEVIGFLPAGSYSDTPVTKGRTIRVMTGAPVPPGTAAVVRLEWCEVSENGQGMRMLRTPRLGESVQPMGSDGEIGQTLVHAGQRLSPLDVAVIQTFGVSQAAVRRVPTAAVFATGSELVADNHRSLGPGQIYGTNDLLLKGALEEDGVFVREMAHLPDDLLQISEALCQAAAQNDYVIVTGGVSVGDCDFTPAAINRLGAPLLIRKVLMRPGSPFVFAHTDRTAVFGLSGNPAACFTQYATLIRPAIRSAMGCSDTPFPLQGVLAHEVSLKPVKHTQIHRAVARMVDGRLTVDCGMKQSTGVISNFAEANAYIRFDEPETPAESIVPLRLIRPL